MQLTRAQVLGTNEGGGTNSRKGKVLVLSLQQAHAALLPTPNVHRQKETKGQDLVEEVNGSRRGKSNIQDLCTALMTREERGAALRRQGRMDGKRP